MTSGPGDVVEQQVAAHRDRRAALRRGLPQRSEAPAKPWRPSIGDVDPCGAVVTWSGASARADSGSDHAPRGADDWKTLYFTSRNHLGSVAVKIPGLPVPTAKR